MSRTYPGPAEDRLAKPLLLGAAGMVLVAATAVLAAALLPVDVPTTDPAEGEKGIEPVAGDERDLAGLLRQAAGSELIRPAQVRAAVKDTGAAGRLAKMLGLQGVVQIEGTFTAYIAVKDQGVKTVREGDKILDFVVKDLEPGRVVLSLDGVEVQLGR